ncbi:MAG TPA: hypothetical protein VJU82_10055 [Acidobacteriaceae bacterium]|nr:hypothetical protein [Acidobacteriaceae bacterium]
MTIHSKLRLMSLAVLGMAGVLAAPGNSEAAVVDGAGCGVCDSNSTCPSDSFRSEQCEAYCNSFIASGCMGGIPGGWTCQGGGVYSNFWQCG